MDLVIYTILSLSLAGNIVLIFHLIKIQVLYSYCVQFTKMTKNDIKMFLFDTIVPAYITKLHEHYYIQSINTGELIGRGQLLHQAVSDALSNIGSISDIPKELFFINVIDFKNELLEQKEELSKLGYEVKLLD